MIGSACPHLKKKKLIGLGGRSDPLTHCSVQQPQLSSQSSLLSMAPVAIYPSSAGADISESTTYASAKGPALVIGSLSTAQDGKYQHVVSELEVTRQVERQMLDRLLDRGNVQFTS